MGVRPALFAGQSEKIESAAKTTTNTSPKPVRYLATIIALLITLGSVAVAVHEVKGVMAPPDASFTGPGKYRFRAPQTTDYTIWFQLSGIVEGEYQQQKEELPPGACLRVEDKAGQLVPTEVGGSATSTINGTSKRTIMHFQAKAQEEYTITTSGFEQKMVFEITHGSFLVPILRGFAAMGAAILGGIFTVVFFLLAITGTFPKRKPAATPAA